MRVEAVTASSGSAQATQALAQTRDFMTLLVAQLQAQDPLAPMDSSQFLAQLAQLQTVSELSSIGTLLSQMRADQALAPALALIGRTVSWHDAVSGALVSAAVEHVELSADGVRVLAGGTELTLDQIVTVA